MFRRAVPALLQDCFNVAEDLGGWPIRWDRVVIASCVVHNDRRRLSFVSLKTRRHNFNAVITPADQLSSIIVADTWPKRWLEQ